MIDIVIEIITAYILIGFIPWLAWCISEVWCDYGRRISTMRKRNVIFIMFAWLVWPATIKTTRESFDSERFNRDYKYYR